MSEFPKGLSGKPQPGPCFTLDSKPQKAIHSCNVVATCVQYTHWVEFSGLG